MSDHVTSLSAQEQELKGRRSKNFYSDEEKSLVRRLFSSGFTSRQIGKEIGRSESSVRGLWRIVGLSRKGSRRPTKWRVDETVFDNAEKREESSYWVGFLLADGCVYRRKGRAASVCLALQKKDKDHVVRFANFVGLSAEIVKESRNSWQMSFQSDRIADVLSKYGVTQRKTLTATPSTVTRSRHFWRGVIDGDGCLSTRVVDYKLSTSEVACLSLTGSSGTISAFSAFASAVVPDCTATPQYREKSNCWVWSTSGRYAKLMISHLYDGSTVALDRKAEKAARIVDDFNDSGVLVLDQRADERLRPKKFLTHNGETKSISEWASALGISRSVISVRISRGWSVGDALDVSTRPYPRYRKGQA